MRLNRSHVLLALGVLAGGAGLAVILEPGILPPELAQYRSILNEQIVSRFTLGLAVFVVLVALYRLLRSKPEDVDRTPIADTPPEMVTGDEAEDVQRQAQAEFDQALSCFDSPDYSTRLVAVYGRRAESVTELDSTIEQYLVELAVTAADAYATTVGCNEKTATRAIATGEWTDDRVAAAFLASDLDSDASFTSWERFHAWLAPERVFKDRVRRVLGEIERYAGTYLTHEGTSDKSLSSLEQMERHTASEQTGTSGQAQSQGETEQVRVDGGNGPHPQRDTQSNATGGTHGE